MLQANFTDLNILKNLPSAFITPLNKNSRYSCKTLGNYLSISRHLLNLLHQNSINVIYQQSNKVDICNYDSISLQKFIFCRVTNSLFAGQLGTFIKICKRNTCEILNLIGIHKKELNLN